MPRSRFSIRHQLLLLGALATASIWTGALLQYLQLRAQSADLQNVRQDLDATRGYAQAARFVAKERGLSNGWLAQAQGGHPAELAPARQDLDTALAQLGAPAGATAGGIGSAEVLAIHSRVEQLPRLRGRIDRRELEPQEAFGFYSSLVGALEDASARRLARGMIVVSVPYEHVIHLQHAGEMLAQLRGQINGVLRAGQLTPQVGALLDAERALYENTLRLYERSVPEAVARDLAASLNAAAVRASVERVNRLLALRQPQALGLDATGWWSLASEAVDTLQLAATRESEALSQRAELRIAEIERRMHLTVLALVVLGIVTLVLVLSTVGRIVRGLDRLLDGLEAVGTRRNFEARIDDSGHDEFGTISTGINKLIAVAGSVVQEQEALSLTDPLTGAMNRRGFDQQLAARTTPGRAHAPPLSLVMIDVDHFKSINDSLGHASGDLVLQGLVQVLRAKLRPDDVLARFGGEEFVALLPGCTLKDGAFVAEKLRQAIMAHDFGIGRPVTASFGVAQRSHPQTADAWIAMADSKLYAAKAAGRNRVMPALDATAAELRRSSVHHQTA